MTGTFYDVRSVKRKALACFKAKQKNHLHNLAPSQPQQFWQELRKLKDPVTHFFHGFIS
jgi:hypothetical protein